MPIAISCPTCGKAGKVPDGAAGLSVTCPACRAKFRLPGAPADGELIPLVLATDAEIKAGWPPGHKAAESPKERPAEEPVRHIPDFGCKKCGSILPTIIAIDAAYPGNVAAFSLAMMLGIFSCGILAAPMFLYYFMTAKRARFCAACGDKSPIFPNAKPEKSKRKRKPA